MEYGIREHALLYALIVKEVLSSFEDGETIVESFTNAYGEKRGARMRRHADEMGYGTSIDAYLMTGEWQGRPGENVSRLSVTDTETVSAVTRCAWCDAWKEAGLLSYGRYYCRWIDKALCEGFAGDFRLTVEQTLSEGKESCIFRWSQRVDPNESAPCKSSRKESFLLPFSFHCQEMLDTAYEVLQAYTSSQHARRIVEAAAENLKNAG